MKNSFLKSKRFKYGSMSVVFTCVFVALIIALNALLSVLNVTANLSVDLSPEKFCEISEDSIAILNDAFKDLPAGSGITVSFCMARDKYDNNDYFRYVRDIAENYSQLYPDRIRVQYLDLMRNPSAVDKYKNETGTNVTAANVIIQGEYHYRILALEAFYVTNEENQLYAFQGELKFTSAFLQCSIKEPQNIAFTVGHGESITDGMLLKDIYRDAGYSVTDVDLSREDIPESTRILIIYNPTNDFIGYSAADPGATTEIDKISEYVNEYNNLIVFVNASTPELPNLQEYLYEYWGMNYKPFHKIYDPENSLLGSAGYEILGKNSTDDKNTYAYQIFQTAVENTGMKLVFNNAVELYSDASAGKGGISVEDVLSTYSTAHSQYSTTKEGDDGKTTTVTEDVVGTYPLMIMSRYNNYKNDELHYNTQIYQYVLLVASTDFGSDDYLAKTYGNRSIMSLAGRLVANQRVTPDIRYKKILSDPIELDAGTATAWMIVLSVLAPLALIIAGVLVFVRRRHL